MAVFAGFSLLMFCQCKINISHIYYLMFILGLHTHLGELDFAVSYGQVPFS